MASAPPSRGERARGVALTAAGILASFLVYGVAQEKIMTTPYGEDGERFDETAFLVLLNRLVAVALAAALMWANRATDKDQFAPAAPLRSYLAIAACNFLSTFAQYEALKYLSFPMQTLGKTGKMVPVLLIGALLQGKKYGAVDYATVAAVTLGSFLFITSGEIRSSFHPPRPHDTFAGMLLLALYLFFDGFTTTSQERLFRAYAMSAPHQMFWVGAWAVVLSILLLLFPIDTLLTTGTLEHNKLGPAVAFAARHPALLADALVLSFAATAGQALIYFCIRTYGALVLSTILTTRQIISILLSALIFAHPITPAQWLAFAAVFGALYFRAFAHRRGEPAGGKPLPLLPLQAKSSDDILRIGGEGEIGVAGNGVGREAGR
ncbi:UAA transporter [Hyaloraphidium curvatum]|nr:UAA transporter [Hyaloraphidium curvatum]